MKKWLWIGGGVVAATVVILVVPGGIAIVAGAVKKLRDKQRARAAEAEGIRVASLEKTLRQASVC